MELYTKKTIDACPYTAHVFIPPKEIHQTTFFVISVVERGEAEIELYNKNGKVSKTVSVSENFCYICGPFSPIRFKNWSSTFCIRNVYIDEKQMKSCCQFLDKNLFNEIMNLNEAVFYKLSSPTIIYFSECVSALVGDKVSPTKDALHRSIVSSLLTQYMFSKVTSNILPKWINGLLRNLDDSSFIVLPVSKMVKSTNYSHGYVNREFKKHLGCSLKQFIIRKKLSLATVMLVTNDMSMQEIADSLNFATVSNFINVFKQRYKVTPAKYRKTYGSAIELDTYQEWGDITYLNK